MLICTLTNSVGVFYYISLEISVQFSEILEGLTFWSKSLRYTKISLMSLLHPYSTDQDENFDVS